MFVQVIQGKVADSAAARAQMEAWMRDLAPTAQGWLGSTAGVTDDGDLIVLARFESEEVAQRNSDRPEQGEWWGKMAPTFDGEPEFRNSTEVDVELAGDPDQAGFVQVMQGRSTDPARARELMTQDPTDWSAYRPEILGTLNAWHDGGEWTMAIYFTSEEEARRGEQSEPPEEFKRLMEELNSLEVGETRYFDLRSPWLDSPS